MPMLCELPDLHSPTLLPGSPTQIYGSKPWDAFSSTRAHLQVTQTKVQTLNQSMFQSSTYCVFDALLDTKWGGKEGCRKEIEGLALTPKGALPWQQ